MKYQRKTTYYPVTTHEFNLPAGWTCPFADDCLTKADRDTGKLVMVGPGYRCYAATAERFPGVRDSRWDNFSWVKEHLKTNDPFPVPEKATHVRIHGSGDFFNQKYFDRWCETAAANPDVQFWAFTKSIQYWVNSMDKVPDNLVLQASRGSKQDHLIDEHDLKCAEVFHDFEDVPEGMPIDFDDTYAMVKGPSFALLENFRNKDQANDERIKRHNLSL